MTVVVAVVVLVVVVVVVVAALPAAVALAVVMVVVVVVVVVIVAVVVPTEPGCQNLSEDVITSLRHGFRDCRNSGLFSPTRPWHKLAASG